MSKGQLQAAQEAYDRDMALARGARNEDRFEDAVAHAIDAWEHVDDMMKYEQRWEDAQFKSVPCIDMVLSYAPLLLDAQSLDRLQRLLKDRKSVDKNASDDLAARLNEARATLKDAYRLWDLIDREPGIRQDAIRSQLGGNQQDWTAIVKRWELMSLVTKTQISGSYNRVASRLAVLDVRLPHHALLRREPMAVLASETASTVAGREGKATSPDGKINLKISPPGSKGPDTGTNPEQLFAAGYSACFGGAIGAAAGLAKIPLRASDIKVTAVVNLNKDDSGGGYFIDVTLNAELNTPGVDQAQAEALVAKAHTICPYSKATRGNIEVKLRANGKAVK